ncbi:Copper amine oxidase family protein isoform 1 [Hibiscus syriacus]|uniref:Copper amine oxidase family protein isoform 1 n=1 Tax=Hibiscus syriacus TaxID=106335 RepID=A0A6A3CRP8_HIBSY|nr:ARM REPEAT PROTEIN INTERACTING WITH ABF2-like [Hibiscus syriacus]KAE8730202.1 Copper amine oxidase family protein isoform 1 [Hibiscus syriacus]
MMGSAEEKRIEDELSYPILLAERVRAAAEEAESFKVDCAEVGKQVDRLSQMLRPLVRSTTSVQSLYERPIRRVVSEVSKNLERALTLVRKCKRQSILRRVVRITSATDFRKVSNLLDASIGDMKWLMGVLDTENNGTASGIFLSLPPIASNDPIISWVWSYIATVQMGQLADRIEAANNLASLARDNDRNKKITVEEGGIPPLLKLLKESSSPEAQIAAANALFALANEQERVRSILDEMGVPIVVQVLGDSPVKVQIPVAKLVATMAEHDPLAQEDFARENVIRPLVTLLSFETFVEDSKAPLGKQSIHSIVINKELEKFSSTGSNSRNFSYRPYGNSYSNLHLEGSSRGGNHRKERENEKPEVKIQLKINCAEALWLLAKGSVSNSRRITETKGLLCLAKLVETEEGELQYNCLMAIMEITAAAESNSDLRRAAFKTNSPAAKAVIDQLLRVIKELNSPTLQVPAIRSVGSLARTFPARETRVIGPLVKQLDNKDQEVAVEAAIALQKFACPDNFLCMDHSKSIIEFNGVPFLMRLLRCGDRAQLHGLVLLCYLAIHAGDNEALEQARVLTALEGADRMVVAHHPDLRELVSRAIYQLNLYHTGAHPQRQLYAP